MNKSDVSQKVLDVCNFPSSLIQQSYDVLMLNYCGHLEKLGYSGGNASTNTFANVVSYLNAGISGQWCLRDTLSLFIMHLFIPASLLNILYVLSINARC